VLSAPGPYLIDTKNAGLVALMRGVRAGAPTLESVCKDPGSLCPPLRGSTP
jgi:hypothetical protein